MDKLLANDPELLEKWKTRYNTRMTESTFQLAEQLVELYYHPDLDVFWDSSDWQYDQDSHGSERNSVNPNYDDRSDEIYIKSSYPEFKIDIYASENSVEVYSWPNGKQIWNKYPLNSPDIFQWICQKIGEKTKL